MLSKKDLEQLSKKGITDIEFENQLNNFQKGFPYINLAGAATVGDGIVHLSDADVQECASFFEKKSNELSMIKFVPASGAASRMFKDIIDLESQYDESENKEAFSKTVKTIENVEKFAFCDELEKALKKDGFNLKTLINENKFSVIASYILKDKGLGYQSKPKAMLLFHKYDNETRTAFEEHLVEGVEYAKMDDKTVHLHFTISPEHRSLFENKIKEVISKYEERYDVKFDIQFSEQMSKTDMVALDKKEN